VENLTAEGDNFLSGLQELETFMNAEAPAGDWLEDVLDDSYCKIGAKWWQSHVANLYFVVRNLQNTTTGFANKISSIYPKGPTSRMAPCGRSSAA
jgi:hypothetical protein